MGITYVQGPFVHFLWTYVGVQVWIQRDRTSVLGWQTFVDVGAFDN